MNLAELGLFLTVLFSALTASVVAHDQHAGWWSLPFAVGGFLLGLPLAWAFNKLAYALLRYPKSGVPGVLSFLLYMLLPLLSVGISASLVGALATILLRCVHAPPAP